MASALENLAASLRALGDDQSAQSELVSISRAVSDLAQRAHAIRVEGVDTRAVSAALEDAVTAMRNAVADLRTLRLHAHSFADALAAGGGTASAAPSTAAPSAPDPALVAGLDSLGLDLLPVSVFDFSSNPITSWNHASPEDHSWAMARWSDTIAPGLASGATREDFEEMDRASGAGDNRRLAMVWDMFLGSDAITPEPPGEDGMRDVTDGRHRIATARALGVLFLPVRRRP